jgi:menaquinone-dependent protoporphyrinogen oxidase
MMKPILITYATREGHTKRVAEYLADRIRSGALPVTVLGLRELQDRFSPNQYSAAVLAASVHVGKHEREAIDFVKHHRIDLDEMLTAFISVSLSQAGAQDERASSESRAKAATDVQKMTDAFLAETQWHPTLTLPLGGALMYRKYNFVLRLIMKQIARCAGASTDTSRDHVFTDWLDLDDLATKLVDRLSVSLDVETRPVKAGQAF